MFLPKNAEDNSWTVLDSFDPGNEKRLAPIMKVFAESQEKALFAWRFYHIIVQL